MEPQDINFLINKYSKSTASHQSEKFYDSLSPKSSFSPFKDPNSKAYASAMRALQERIRFLESENSELYESYRKSEESFQEQRRISEKLANDLESLKTSQVLGFSELTDLKHDNYNLKIENSTLQARLKDLENHQIHGLSKENYDLKSELDVTMRDLSHRKAQEIDYIENIKKLEEEKAILQDELSSQRWKANDEKDYIKKEAMLERRRVEEEKRMLQDELSNEKWRLREVMSENQNIKSTLSRAEQKDFIEKEMKKKQDFEKSELQKQNEEYFNTIKDLERKYDLLSEKNRTKSPGSRKSFGKSDKVSSKTVSFRRNRSKSKHNESTSPSSPRLSRPYNRHIGAHTFDYGNASEKIIRMEKEIDILTKKYRKLISSSNSESSGLGKLKTEIGKLAEELETKNEELKKIKLRTQYLID